MTTSMSTTAEETNSAKLPSAPPPSLVTDSSSTCASASGCSTQYDRSSLLALAQTPQSLSLSPPKARRLSSFSPILKNDPSDELEWGVDESISSILDDQPISKYLPIPIPNQIGKASKGHPRDVLTNDKDTDKDKRGQVLFNFSSIGSDGGGLPVMIDFKNPFEDALIKTQTQTQTQTQSNFSSPPSSVGGREIDKDDKLTPDTRKPSIAVFHGNGNPSHTSEANTNALRLSLSGLLANPTNNQSSRSISPSSSIRSSLSSRSSFSAITGEKLNPFAPPFFSNTAPTQSHPSQQKQKHLSSVSFTTTKTERRPSAAAAAAPSLPLPKAKATPNLPCSLPAKPGPLPPIFIKRESAALPQPMAQPDITPLGKSWEGENALSGNDRRRRQSAIAIPSESSSLSSSFPTQVHGNSTSASSLRTTPNSSPEVRGRKLDVDVVEQRPERLVMLGKKLRDSISSSSSSPSQKIKIEA